MEPSWHLVYKYVCVCVCTYIYIYTYIYVYVYICMYVYIYTYIHTYPFFLSSEIPHIHYIKKAKLNRTMGRIHSHTRTLEWSTKQWLELRTWTAEQWHLVNWINRSFLDTPDLSCILWQEKHPLLLWLRCLVHNHMMTQENFTWNCYLARGCQFFSFQYVYFHS